MFEDFDFHFADFDFFSQGCWQGEVECTSEVFAEFIESLEQLQTPLPVFFAEADRL